MHPGLAIIAIVAKYWLFPFRRPFYSTMMENMLFGHWKKMVVALYPGLFIPLFRQRKLYSFFFLSLGITLSLLSPSVFEHRITTCSPSKHPPTPSLTPSHTHTHTAELMTLTCDYDSLWRSPAAPLQTRTQAAAAETQQTPDLCTQGQMWWQNSLTYTHMHPTHTEPVHWMEICVI